MTEYLNGKVKPDLSLPDIITLSKKFSKVEIREIILSSGGSQ